MTCAEFCACTVCAATAKEGFSQQTNFLQERERIIIIQRKFVLLEVFLPLGLEGAFAYNDLLSHISMDNLLRGRRGPQHKVK